MIQVFVVLSSEKIVAHLQDVILVFIQAFLLLHFRFFLMLA